MLMPDATYCLRQGNSAEWVWCDPSVGYKYWNNTKGEYATSLHHQDVLQTDIHVFEGNFYPMLTCRVNYFQTHTRTWFKQYLFDSSMIILSTTLMNAGFDNKI